MNMLNKKEKLIIAAFVVSAIVGFIGTAYFLFFGNNSNEENENTESQIENVLTEEERLESEVEDSLNIEESKEVEFDSEEKREMSEEDIDQLLFDVEILIEDQAFEEIIDLLNPIIEQYNLTSDKGRQIKNHYTDANLMVVQSSMSDPKERANVINGLLDPMTMVLSTPLLTSDVFLNLPIDIYSMNVANQTEESISLSEESIFYPITVDEEQVDGSTFNPELKDSPIILNYLDILGNFYDVRGIHYIPVKIQGVPMTAYVSAMKDDSLILIGYYVDDEVAHGDRFQTVNWFLSHRQQLEDAVKNNWEN